MEYLAQFAVVFYGFLGGFKFILCAFVKVKLKAELTRQGYVTAHIKACYPAHLMVRHSRNVRAHCAEWVNNAYAVLNFKALHRIAVVARPDMGHIVKHTRVKPRTAACAALKKNVRETMK